MARVEMALKVLMELRSPRRNVTVRVPVVFRLVDKRWRDLTVIAPRAGARASATVAGSKRPGALGQRLCPVRSSV